MAMADSDRADRRHFYLLISMTLVTSCWHSALASRAIAFTYSRNFESLILRPAAMSKRAGATTSSQTKRTKTQQSLSGFFASNSKKTNEDVKSSEEISSDAPSTTSSGYKVFCDLDGVLVDFDSGVKKLFNGRAPDELPNQGMMWGSIHKASEFYAKLPWMKDGKFLWEELKNNLSTPPDILTGCPRRYVSFLFFYAFWFNCSIWFSNSSLSNPFLFFCVFAIFLSAIRVGQKNLRGAKKSWGCESIIWIWRGKSMLTKLRTAVDEGRMW